MTSAPEDHPANVRPFRRLKPSSSIAPDDSGYRDRGGGRASRDAKSAKPNARPNDLVTEDAAAQLFATRHVDQLRFCHDAGGWFDWNGNLWRRNRVGAAFQFARELARDLAKTEPDRVRYVASKTSFASGVERFARSDPSLAVTSRFWDRDPFLLGTPAGIVDLRSGDVLDPDPADGISKSTAVPVAPAAACPLWLRFLEETTGGDAELIRFLRQFCGYALTGDVREHVLLFGYGAGGNGKSVFLNTVAGILGDYATTAAMDTFAASQGSTHPTDLAMLHGARLVTASETEEGRAWAEARIKAITGGDPISARFMRRDFFTFNPTFKLFIVGNHKPVLHNVDEAARRRFCIVPFTRTPTRPDRELEAKLKAEWPAILRWMVDGCLDWQRNGLTRPRSVVDATADYFAAQDVLGQWLADECDCEPGNPHKVATSAELFAAWSAFAKAAGEDAGSKRAFAEAMQRRGFEPTRSRTLGRCYQGVRMKPKGRDA